MSRLWFSENSVKGAVQNSTILSTSRINLSYKVRHNGSIMNQVVQNSFLNSSIIGSWVKLGYSAWRKPSLSRTNTHSWGLKTKDDGLGGKMWGYEVEIFTSLTPNRGKRSPATERLPITVHRIISQNWAVEFPHRSVFNPITLLDRYKWRVPLASFTRYLIRYLQVILHIYATNGLDVFTAHVYNLKGEYAWGPNCRSSRRDAIGTSVAWLWHTSFVPSLPRILTD